MAARVPAVSSAFQEVGGRAERAKETLSVHSALLSSVCACLIQHFGFHLLDKNLVLCLYLTIREDGKCSLLLTLNKIYLLLPRKKERLKICGQMAMSPKPTSVTGYRAFMLVFISV